MKVRIVCYEGAGKWILGKFARKMQEHLVKLGVECDIDTKPSDAMDVNHHIIFLNYKGKRHSKVETLMITHIDSTMKLSQLIAQEDAYDTGVCMSKETMDKLIKGGVKSSKLTYILPAHDEVMKPRKLILGITSKTHNDGRKKEDTLVTICRHIPKEDFSFKIMGAGWTGIVAEMRQLGFEVEYFEEFDYDTYVAMMPTLDYYLYMSFDEGSMGFIDAVAAGVQTIVTPQGYHLDAPGTITHSVSNHHDIIRVLNEIADKRKTFVDSVSEWTWENYAKNHLMLWNRLLGKPTAEIEINEPIQHLKRPVKMLYIINSFFYKTAKKIFGKKS
ncbi:MAG: hypothetical protein ABJA78_03680 [Ferruginibacter sp.]